MSIVRPRVSRSTQATLDFLRLENGILRRNLRRERARNASLKRSLSALLTILNKNAKSGKNKGRKIETPDGFLNAHLNRLAVGHFNRGFRPPSVIYTTRIRTACVVWTDVGVVEFRPRKKGLRRSL